MRGTCRWRAGVGLACLWLTFVTHAGCARADPHWREVWSGADISPNVWLLYSGVTISPWGDVKREGLLLRIEGGYGGYTYADAAPQSVYASVRAFEAVTYFTNLLVGYQMRFGELTAKAFVGPSLISHEIEPFDDETLVYGADFGVKGGLEFWLNLGPDGYASLDLGWSTAHETRSARTRIGYRVWPRISLGLEASINVDAQGECRMGSLAGDTCAVRYDEESAAANLLDYARAGGFVRYEWDAGEFSTGLGVLGGVFDNEFSATPDPYVTFNWLMQF